MSVTLDIQKRLGDFSLQIGFDAGDEVVSLLGASGCGKSVTLNCIAGILKPDRGKIIVDGRTLYDGARRISLNPQERRVGYLFQSYALFENMTVMQNIRMGGRRNGADAKRIQTVLKRFELEDVADLHPSQISGGQQQRTALARILISEPDILLLDEPFSALDAHLRFRMEEELRSLIREFKKTVIFVSHNRDEVFRLSDRVVIMENGKADVSGTKAEVFSDPKTCNAARLTGCKNISPIRIVDEHHLEATDWGLVLSVEKIPENAKYVGIRMHYIHAGEGENGCECEVVEEIENPFSYTLMLRLKDGEKNLRCFGWETDKRFWESMRAKTVKIHIPEGSLHFLER